MDNPFYIKSGNVAQPIMQGLDSAITRTGQRNQAAEQEAAAAARETEINTLMDGIYKGDRQAALGLAALDPKMSAEIRAVTGAYDDSERNNINQWISGLVGSGYSDEYLAEDAPFEIDDQLRSLPADQRELVARAFAAHSMQDDDSYSRLFGAQTSPDKVGQYNPRDYTTDSWAKFSNTGDPASLERFQTDRKMTAAGEKALINSQTRFRDLSEQAREYELLADDFDRFQGDLPAGSSSTIGEFFKSKAGSQNEISELRRRFNKVRLGEALKYLPPGPATDRDVEEAFKGVPKETASPEQVKSFLRGSAKLARVNSEFEEFKSNYISENQSTSGLIKAWQNRVDNGQVDSINRISESPEVATETNVVAGPDGVAAEETTVQYQGADKQAYDWAQANQGDPRAAAILQRLGAQ